MESPVAKKQVGLATIFRNQEEHLEPVEATVTGKIPEWIRGTYLRVGPGKFDIGDVTMKNFMDGYAMLTKFQIEDGKVSYTKRFLESDAYKKAIAAKKPVYPEFTTKGNPGEGKSFFNRVLDAFGSAGITDNDTVSLYTIEGNVYAASETCHINNVNPSDLSTTANKIDYYKYFGVYMASAHPQRCSKTGDLYNIGTSFKPTCKYQVIRIPNLGGNNAKQALKKAEVVATIYPSFNTCVSYFHSFAMTENYIIHIEQPFLMNLLKMAESKMMGKGFRDAMDWDPNEKNRFHIVDKRTGELLKTKYFSDIPFFYFHTANAYEISDDMIVMDIDTYEDSKVIDKMNVEMLRKEAVGNDCPAQLKRFYIPVVRNLKDVAKNQNLVRFDKTTASAIRENDSIILTGEVVGEPGFEGPIVNPNFATKQHRYIYGTGACLPGYYAHSICKLDLEKGDTKLWKESTTTYPGEPLFLLPPDAKKEEEDKGILLAAISDSNTQNQDFIVFIDSQTMEEVARASVSVQIPQSVHGVFLPS